MAVLLADRLLSVRVLPHPWTRDANGTPVPPNPATPPQIRGTWPGAATEQPDGSWSLRLNPAAWPVREGDTVTDDAGLSWTVTAARNQRVPGCTAADYVQVTATLNPPKEL
ncbi:hypothetical protein G3I60_05325 [Streptomyces sp. SID13666]|uniref:hypothetical protein n=1 Tax=Streptomyces sp. SID13666 TaxID=2706054 RepID=UPI0013C22619|nr:hypothetical protein [Streptomyces sp. SID13666]NEA53592.1 hypothetical protein [Streptomyces sp. SID13666]